MAKSKRDSTQAAILAYLKRRSTAAARAAVGVQKIVRQQCSAAGVEPTNEGLALMAAALSTYNHSEYAPGPAPKDEKSAPTNAAGDR